MILADLDLTWLVIILAVALYGILALIFPKEL